MTAWVSVIEKSFPDRKRVAAIEIPSDWREQDAAEMGELLRGTFAELTLVIEPHSPTTENLYKTIQHPTLRMEKAWPEAIDRIIGEAGPSDFIFVGPSKRARCDQANEHCTKRNMVRLS
jgi:hypothetical protein